MDENEYRDIYKAYNTVPCPFEKALLTRCCSCENLHKINIAEREAASCTDPGAQINCVTLLDLLHENARFALHLTHMAGNLPHGKEIKVQCGGIRGIQMALPESEPAREGLANIHRVVSAAMAEFGHLGKLPFSSIVQSITSHKGRRRLRDRPQ